MNKEKVFVVISHKHVLKKYAPANSKKRSPDDWEVAETIEFVNQIRNKHTSSSSAIADYNNRKMVIGSRFGFDTYDKFDEYIHTKYPKQMAELNASYKSQQVSAPLPEKSDPLFTDKFGNVRLKTVFD